MKKTYIEPNTLVVLLQTERMVADSIEVSTGSTPTDPGSSDARETQAWDIWGEGIDDDFDE